ncbi:hypothetical protein [Herpetosiphon geysericola]|nr:hypothetical protein [Herpetosiphon geysericola]
MSRDTEFMIKVGFAIGLILFAIWALQDFNQSLTDGTFFDPWVNSMKR